jgi:hypothetical protein
MLMNESRAQPYLAKERLAALVATTPETRSTYQRSGPVRESVGTNLAQPEGSGRHGATARAHAGDRRRDGGRRAGHSAEEL